MTHNEIRAAALKVLQHAYSEAKEGRRVDYWAELSALGFKHTYRAHTGRKVWEPEELTAETERRGTRGVLSSRFFTLYESPDGSRYPWLSFVAGRIGNTVEYAIDTSTDASADATE